MGLLVPLAVIVLWQLVAWAGLLHYEYLPAPLEVIASLVELARTGELVRDTVHTLGVTLTAAGITSALGAAVGLAVGLLPTLRDYVVASIDFLRTIPAVTLIPVAILTFGPVATTELMLAMYAALWSVVLCTAGAAAAVHPPSVRHRANAAFLPRHNRSKDCASRGCAGLARRCAFGRGHRAACRARRGNDHVPARAGRGSDRVAQRAGAGAHVGIRARVRCHRIRAQRCAAARCSSRHPGESGQCGR